MQNVLCGGLNVWRQFKPALDFAWCLNHLDNNVRKAKARLKFLRRNFLIFFYCSIRQWRWWWWWWWQVWKLRGFASLDRPELTSLRQCPQLGRVHGDDGLPVGYRGRKHTQERIAVWVRIAHYLDFITCGNFRPEKLEPSFRSIFSPFWLRLCFSL